MKLSRDVENLYRTQDYGSREPIDGVVTVPLRRFRDEGGALLEIFRAGPERPPGLGDFEVAQITYTTIHPEVIKAFHLHREQTDVWFVPPEDRVLLVLVDVRSGSSSEGRCHRVLLGDGVASLIKIPPGVAHGCRNLGREIARVFYLTDRGFSAEPRTCDEGRLPWDLPGAEVWEIPRE